MNVNTNMFSRSVNGHNEGQAALGSIIVSIQTGYWAALINELRALPTKAERGDYKATRLQCFVTAVSGWAHGASHGECTGLQYTGYCVLDWDNLDVARIEEYKAKIVAEIPAIAAAFISPSGNGIKAILRIPLFDSTFTKEEYARWYKALKNQIDDHFTKLDGFSFPLLDGSGSNRNRLCYVSYDPLAYMHYNQCEVPIFALDERYLLAQTQKLKVRAGNATTSAKLDRQLTCSVVASWHGLLLDGTGRNNIVNPWHGASSNSGNFHVIPSSNDLKCVCFRCNKPISPVDLDYLLTHKRIKANATPEELTAAHGLTCQMVLENYKGDEYKAHVSALKLKLLDFGWSKIEIKDALIDAGVIDKLAKMKLDEKEKQELVAKRLEEAGIVRNEICETYDVRNENGSYRLASEADMSQVYLQVCVDSDDGVSKDKFKACREATTATVNPVKDYFDRLTPNADASAYRAFMKFLPAAKQPRKLVENLMFRWFQMACNQVHGKEVNFLMPIIIGSQGAGKSTWATRICPDALSSRYLDTRMHVTNDTNQCSRQQKSKFLVVDDEQVKASKREIEEVKHLLTNNCVTYRGVYKEQINTYQRLSSYIATTNQEDVLTDEENRRLFPIDTTVSKHFNCDKTCDQIRNFSIDNVWAYIKYVCSRNPNSRDMKSMIDSYNAATVVNKVVRREDTWVQNHLEHDRFHVITFRELHELAGQHELCRGISAKALAAALKRNGFIKGSLRDKNSTVVYFAFTTDSLGEKKITQQTCISVYEKFPDDYHRSGYDSRFDTSYAASRESKLGIGLANIDVSN